MATHYCIGNPCWICFPEHAPKQEDKIYKWWPEMQQDRLLHPDKISGMLEELIIDVFKQGLDEDTHHWSIKEPMTLESIKEERTKLQDGTLEARLLDLMIADFDAYANRQD